MKNKALSKIILALSLLIVVGGITIPHLAHADTIDLITNAVINHFIGWIVNSMLLPLAAGFVTAGGVFLNFSINLTIHIKDLYERVPAIGLVWVTIRNISSIFIIFMLLYISISTILSINGAGFGKLVGKVFMAGLLINFSLFFVKVGVDASNLVSLQFYNAIAPEASKTIGEASSVSAYYDGGLSNIFMSSLKIPTIYSNTTFLKSADVALATVLAGLAGVLIMITAAISFFAAAIAFTIRTAVLLFIMAMSPVFFVGMIFPEVEKEVGKPLLNLLKNQLIFMPTYLLLTYVSLRFISDPGFTSIFNQSASAATASGSIFGPAWVGTIMQYTMALIFINAPLAAAIKLGAMGMDWAPDVKSVTGFFGQHTIGRAAKGITSSDRFKDFASRNPSLGVIADKGLSKVSGATFLGTKGGYDKRFKDYTKNQTEFGKKLGYSKRDVNAGLAEFDSNLRQERDNLRDAQDKAEQAKDASRYGGGNEADLKAALRAVEDQRDKVEKMSKPEERTRKEKELEQARSTSFVQEMEKTRNPLTKKARKEAADAIRKELKKGKKDKAIDAIKDLLEESGEKAPKEESGGDKPKV